jgi:hypothetical protein
LQLASYTDEVWPDSYQLGLLRYPECRHVLVGQQPLARPPDTDEVFGEPRRTGVTTWAGCFRLQACATIKAGRPTMTIILRPEQERVLMDAIDSGLAHDADEALDQALDALRGRMPSPASAGTSDESVAAAARRLATLGKRHGLSLGGLTVKELLRESRP